MVTTLSPLRRSILCAALLSPFLGAEPADRGGAVIVRIAEDASPIVSATGETRAMKLSVKATATVGREAKFEGLLPATPYDLAVTLKDGTRLQGADLSWYADLPPATPEAEAIGDDDREQIDAILKNPQQFYNRSDLLLLAGNHDRAVALVQLIRDSAFHSDAGGEVIWRIELWYFQNDAGGWEKVQQQNKVLRRERFKSKAEFDDAARGLKWLPELGGVRIDAKAAEPKVISIAKDAIIPPKRAPQEASADAPATRPTTSGSPSKP